MRSEGILRSLNTSRASVLVGQLHRSAVRSGGFLRFTDALGHSRGFEHPQPRCEAWCDPAALGPRRPT